MSNSIHIPAVRVLLKRAVTDLHRWLNSTWAAGMVPANAERVPEMSVVCVAGSSTNCAGADLICPIRVEGSPGLAALVAVGPRVDGAAYTEDDHRLAETLCRHLTGLLSNAALAQRISDDLKTQDETRVEAEAARGIYERLDHTCPPQQIPELEYGGLCHRADQACGNLFELLPRGNNELFLAVGNVDARGLPAGILMGGVLGAVRALVSRGERLVNVVAELNRTLWEIAPEGTFTTFLCARIDPRNRVLRFVNAGQEPALLLRKSGPVDALEPTGAVLGLSQRSTYRERMVLFEPGDLLAAFTEGIAEVTGLEKVVRTLRDGARCGVQEMAANLLASASEGGDRTVVLVRYNDVMACPAPMVMKALAAA